LNGRGILSFGVDVYSEALAESLQLLDGSGAIHVRGD
jgi:hypothetical protein